MLGSFGSAALYYGFAFLMVIWMVVKIARGSALLAIATFFIWPLAIVSLFRNWRDPDTDIRIPFFAFMLALGLSLFMAKRGVNQAYIEGAGYFSDEDLALIQQEDPAAYAQIMQERERIVAEGGSLDDYYVDEDYGDDEEGDSSDSVAASNTVEPTRSTSASSSPTAGSASNSGPAATAPADSVVDEDPLLALPSAAAGLSYIYAMVDWPLAGVSIELPSRFRYLPPQRVRRLAELRRQPLLPASFGWIVHETVDLAQPDAWVLEVDYLDVGHTPLGLEQAVFVEQLAELAGVQQRGRGGRRLGEGNFAPQWDANRRVLTWSLTDEEGRLEQRAALPLRSGLLLFVVRGLTLEQRELGLRLTRLMANRVAVPESKEWRPAAEAGEPTSKTSLIGWVRGDAMPSP